MSLIITSISHHGITTVTDSNTTERLKDGTLIPGGTSKKLFSGCSGAVTLSFCGRCQIQGRDAEKWLSTFCQNSDGDSITTLASNLLHELTSQTEVTNQIFHIAGIDRSTGSPLAYFGHISSVDLLSTGYVPKSGGYNLSWQIDGWPRDRFASVTHSYANGFGDGRDRFFTLHSLHHQWLNDPSAKFCLPDLSAQESILQAQLNYISGMFTHSGYGAPIIGGPVQTQSLPW